MYVSRSIPKYNYIKSYASNGALELRPTLHHQLQSATAMRHSQIQSLMSLISGKRLSDCVSLFAFVTGNFPPALIIKQREIFVVRLCWPCTTTTPLQRSRNMKLTQLICSYKRSNFPNSVWHWRSRRRSQSVNFAGHVSSFITRLWIGEKPFRSIVFLPISAPSTCALVRLRLYPQVHYVRSFIRKQRHAISCG